MQQEDRENLVVNDFAHELRDPAQGSIEVERGVDNVRHFEQKRINMGLDIVSG